MGFTQYSDPPSLEETPDQVPEETPDKVPEEAPAKDE
jgi:hypothetical protein